jgi:hypothetical protein
MIAKVSRWADQSVSDVGDEHPVPESPHAPTSEAPDVTKKPGPRLPAVFTLAAGAALCLALVLAFLFYGKLAKNNRSVSAAIGLQPVKSIAVLPFLDLTDDMNQEPFADGMTEELIDKLSKLPAFAYRLPRPPSISRANYGRVRMGLRR